MYNIKLLNSISKEGTSLLNANDFTIDAEAPAHGILVRSADMHDYALDKETLAIARAGAGTNNIPIDSCTEKGIVVFNTPGANANAVKELVLTAIFISSRKVLEGIEWTKTLSGQENIDELVESGKKNFAGPEISGKTLGVIGLGAIGILVANAATALGMNVIGYDPYLSVSSALSMNSKITLVESIELLIKDSNYITLHIPQTEQTKGMINSDLISIMKPGTKLLNFARGGLVNNAALKAGLENGTIEKYITDFPSNDIISLKNVISIPHLGASTPESESNCASMAAAQIKAYLKYGIIKNSVNFPQCEAIYHGKPRISVIHKNIPNMIGSISAAIASENLNIDNMVSKAKNNIAYALIDIDSLNGSAEKLLDSIHKIDGVIKARLILEEI